jgi:hypothetical protein
MNPTTPKVVKVMQFADQLSAAQKLRDLGAMYRKQDEDTRLPLYKTSAGVVLRVRGTSIEVLSNCVC